MTEKQEPLTMRAMCEYIAKWIKEMDGKDVDPQAIYMMHPGGELYPVFELYHMAKAWYEAKGKEACEHDWQPASGFIVPNAPDSGLPFTSRSMLLHAYHCKKCGGWKEEPEELTEVNPPVEPT